MDHILTFRPKLEEWTELSQFTVLYDSATDEYTARAFNSKVTGHEHVMLVVVTADDNVFGSYNGKHVPTKTEAKVTKTGYFVDCDEDFFIFSLKNPANTPPQIYVSHKHSESLLIFPNSNPEKGIVGTVCAFWLYEDHAFISKMFHSNFQTPEGVVAENTALTGDFYPTYFQVKQLLALEWSNN